MVAATMSDATAMIQPDARGEASTIMSSGKRIVSLAGGSTRRVEYHLLSRPSSAMSEDGKKSISTAVWFIPATPRLKITSRPPG